MSRRRNALVGSVFAYAQYGVAIVVNVALVPIVLAQVDVRSYGLWLAGADLLGYVGLLDLGVFGVLPWLIAEADGRRDPERIRYVLSHALAAALLMAVACTVAAFAAWSWFPDLLAITPAERATLAGPLLVLLCATAVSLPLNVYNGALAGMQDVSYNGTAALVRAVAGAALTIALLLVGHGLNALAWGTAVPAVLGGLAGWVRFRIRFSHLARDWPWPGIAGLKALVRTSVGSWLGAFGWRLMAMSNGLVLTATGHPELVPMYSCTSRLSSTLLQMGWVAPDSGLLPLAHLHGERNPQRLREIVRAMVSLHLIVAGGAAVVVLAVNPSFVAWWVSEALFGGHWLNLLLASGMIVAALAHATATIASVLGRRLEIGLAGIANGLVQVAGAYALALLVGFQGVAIAAIGAAVLTTVPVGLTLLGRQTGTSARALVGLVARWALRATGPLVVALAIGTFMPLGPLWLVIGAGLPVGLAYVWLMRPFYVDMPIEARFRSILEQLRLLPPLPTPTEPVA
jgi:O-antigen/teichoic acid export membrane protein